MNSRALLNIALLITVIALASFLFWNNNDTSYLKLKLTSLEKNEIKIITIPRDKGDIILKLTGSGWHMEAPYQVAAHDFRINQILNITQLIATNSYDIDDLDLSRFNLSPSDTTVIFNDTRLEFGKTNPVNLLRYVKSNNQLFLVKENIYPLLRAQPSSFVSLSLLPGDNKIKSITLPDHTLIKDSNNNWKITPEVETTADAIQEFIQNWKTATAFGVHAYMPRKNLGQVKINIDNKWHVFEITDNDPWLILARKDLGLEYHLDKSQLKTLLQIQPVEEKAKQ